MNVYFYCIILLYYFIAFSNIIVVLSICKLLALMLINIAFTKHNFKSIVNGKIT